MLFLQLQANSEKKEKKKLQGYSVYAQPKTEIYSPEYKQQHVKGIVQKWSAEQIEQPLTV